MDFSTEITIMGRNSIDAIYDHLREPAARFVQKFLDGDTIFMQDAKSFASAVVARADGGKIHRLNIADHGTANGCWFGKDYIYDGNFERYAQYLAKVAPYLTKTAIVHLQHCMVGQNTDLMRMFAMIFNVRVYAGTGIDAGAPFNNNTGDYVGCTPAGTMFKEVRRP
jgi:hypothetical protein